VKKTILPLLMLTLAFFVSMTPLVSASSTYTVNLLVAYDEEWTSISISRYAYDPKVFAAIIVDDAFFEFYVEFYITYRIIAYRSWDSDDSVTNKDVMMNEVIAETGFTSGMFIGGIRVDVLVAFSDQESIGVYGYSDNSLGVLLVMETYLDGVGQATDNVFQHELSHLYGATDEWIEGHTCVMNVYPYWIDFPYYYYVPTALVTNNWCSSQTATIMSNRGSWGRNDPSGLGGCMGTVWHTLKAIMEW